VNPSSSVFVSIFVIVGTTILRRVREGKWEGTVIETVIFGFMLLLALQLLSLVMPQLAKVLGYLGIVGAFVVNGPAIFGYAKDFQAQGIPRVGRAGTPTRRGSEPVTRVGRSAS
jgi:hypothetical protein